MCCRGLLKLYFCFKSHSPITYKSPLSLWQKSLKHVKYHIFNVLIQCILYPTLYYLLQNFVRWGLLKMDRGWGLPRWICLLANFFFNAFVLWHQIFSLDDRGTEASLTDVLWHELSLADASTAEDFDSVHFKYPAPSGDDQNRCFSQHCGASSTSQSVTTVKKWELQTDAHFTTWQWPVASC